MRLLAALVLAALAGCADMDVPLLGLFEACGGDCGSEARCVRVQLPNEKPRDECLLRCSEDDDCLDDEACRCASGAGVCGDDEPRVCVPLEWGTSS